MEFTFGIITSGDADHYIQKNVDVIRKTVKSRYEIIIVGASKVSGSDIQNVPFIEFQKPKPWITRKKNIIAELANYENIVIMHDYYLIDDNWYDGFSKFGTNFSVCITPVVNHDGTRFRDYCIFPNFLPYPFNQTGLLPYDFKPSNNMYKFMYVTGGYYILKKEIALKYPMREELFHDAGDDIILCQDFVDANVRITCNPFSTAHTQKFKPKVFCENEINASILNLLNSLDNETIDRFYTNQKQGQREWIFNTYGIVIS